MSKTFDEPNCGQALAWEIDLTQNRYHDVILQDLDRPTGQEVEHGEDIPPVDQRVPWWGMGVLEPHGQGSQTALSGPLEGLAVLQQALVEMQADISLQALWEAL